MQNWEIVGQLISIVLISFSLVFTLGIIWRAEMRLDSAYKVFFGALVCLFLIRVMDIFVKNEMLLFIYQFLNLVFAILLFWGTWLMRDLMRNIDGEK